MQRATGNSYDRDVAAALVRGAAAAYGDDREMRAWAQAQGCDGCEVFRDERTDTLGFAAATEECAFVVFRGTRDLRNWITDLDCGLVEVRLPNADCGLKGEVHEGFLRALEAVWEELGVMLDKIARGRAEIFFAGHSLGGALAMLAAARWEAQSPGGDGSASRPYLAPWLYTFGQPRVGNGAWARWYDDCGRAVPALNLSGGTPLPQSGSTLHDRSFRVVHAADIVPRVPWLLNCYRHAGTEIFYDALGAEHVDWPWWRKAPGDVFGSWSEWTRSGRVAALGDHGVGTYLEMLKC